MTGRGESVARFARVAGDALDAELRRRRYHRRRGFGKSLLVQRAMEWRSARRCNSWRRSLGLIFRPLTASLSWRSAAVHRERNVRDVGRGRSWWERDGDSARARDYYQRACG